MDSRSAPPAPGIRPAAPALPPCTALAPTAQKAAPAKARLVIPTRSRIAPGGQLPLIEAERQRQRAVKAEYYRTPAWVIEALLHGGGPELPGGLWLDPCAGDGAIPRAVNRYRHDVEWLLCELREECRPALKRIPNVHPGGLVIEDFLAAPSPAPAAWAPVAVVIFNSPFTLTIPFVEQAWQYGAWVVSLQRQSFIGYARAHWLRRHMPDRYVLPGRPSFRADGRKDGAEYEWHVWPFDGRKRRAGRTRMLEMPRQLELTKAQPHGPRLD